MQHSAKTACSKKNLVLEIWGKTSSTNQIAGLPHVTMVEIVRQNIQCQCFNVTVEISKQCFATQSRFHIPSTLKISKYHVQGSWLPLLWFVPYSVLWIPWPHGPVVDLCRNFFHTNFKLRATKDTCLQVLSFLPRIESTSSYKEVRD